MTYTIIILVIYVAAHIIAALAKKAAERKEQERVRAEMQRRRAQEGGVATAPSEIQVSSDPIWGQPGGPANPLPPTVRTGKPIDDLAARRKEQLEQLRLRRAGKRPAGSTSVPPTRPGGMPDLAEYDHVARQETERREQEQARARRERQQRETQKREAARTRREQVKRDQLKRDQAKLEQARQNAEASARTLSKEGGANSNDAPSPRKPTVHAVSHPAPVLGSQLRGRLQNPAALRELFVLKEILDPPVSVRQ